MSDIIFDNRFAWHALILGGEMCAIADRLGMAADGTRNWFWLNISIARIRGGDVRRSL